MRYYSIVITNPATGAVIVPASLAPLGLPATYSSLFANGLTNPGALNIELDLYVTDYALPAGSTASFVRIWGISLQEISQAFDLNGMNISVYAGMQKGLPLANPAQSGLIVQGTVMQAFGNWIGSSMTLDLLITAAQNANNAPKNIVLNWKAGTPLATAIKNTLATAFPTYTANINISPNLVLNHDEPGYFSNIVQFAQYLRRVSQDIMGGTYRGVGVVLRETTFNVFDGTSETTPIQIQFTDLIGQPTWIASNTIQVSCVMRADLSVGDYVKLPTTATTTTPQSLSQYRNTSSFQGTFQIVQLRHIGNFRYPDGSSWITTIDVVSA